MKDLLEGLSECWSSDGNAVELRAVSLDLAEAFSSAFGAALIVRVEIAGIVERSRGILAEQRHFMNGAIGE